MKMKYLIQQISKQLVLIAAGGLIYCSIEVLGRGYTHWTMGVVGAICFLFLGIINESIPYELSITTQMLIGMAFITLMELLAGCVLNLWLGLNIWNYSNEQYNILGQISLKHSCYWFLLSGVGIVLDDYLRYFLFKEDLPKYRL